MPLGRHRRAAAADLPARAGRQHAWPGCCWRPARGRCAAAWFALPRRRRRRWPWRAACCRSTTVRAAADRDRGRRPGQRAARQEPARPAPGHHGDREPRGGHRAARRAGQGGHPARAGPGDLAGELHRSGSRSSTRRSTHDRRRGAGPSTGRCWSARCCRTRCATPASCGLPGRGPATVYVKRQLVPFGEDIPFRGLLSHITSLVALQPVNFTAGPPGRGVPRRAGSGSAT